MLTLLTGHTTPETAYNVDDYPYGRTLRCKIRYWVETATKGSGKGQSRPMRQTTDARRDNIPWNKPKAGTYSDMVFLYLDTRNNHVRFWAIGHYTNVYNDAYAMFVASGLYNQLPQADKDKLDKMLALTRKMNPTSAAEWTEKVEKVKAGAEEHGLENPDLYKLGGFDDLQKRYVYEKDFHAIVALLKAEKGIYTLPKMTTGEDD